MMPAWKKEGYCEYIAGGSTLDYDTGVRLWKANPNDGTGYLYFKYYMLVKYLLETEKLTVEELFTRDIDLATLEAKFSAVFNHKATKTLIHKNNCFCVFVVSKLRVKKSLGLPPRRRLESIPVGILPASPTLPPRAFLVKNSFSHEVPRLWIRMLAWLSSALASF